jgi:uncharacterized damage-inducible protein DinB
MRWVQRGFEFNFPASLYPGIVERVRGTPARLEDLLKDISADIASRRDGDAWSMQENAGHLLDLEPLLARRLDEYLAGASELHAADMSNRKTHEANHNTVSLSSILSKFREQRLQLSARLDQLPPETFERVAIHPRLNKPMRLVDMLYFQAEHDDHHLARISELIRKFGTSKLNR